MSKKSRGEHLDMVSEGVSNNIISIMSVCLLCLHDVRIHKTHYFVTELKENEDEVEGQVTWLCL